MATKGSANGSVNDPSNGTGLDLNGNGQGGLQAPSGRNGDPGTSTSKPKGQRRPARSTTRPVKRKSTPLLDEFDVLKDMIADGLYPYGSEDDPAWDTDRTAMGLICNRTHDGYRKRKVPTVKLQAIEGGFEGRVIDTTLGYECVFMFRDIELWFEAFSAARREPRNWKEIDYGEGAQSRKAKRKKEFDEAADEE